MIITEFLDNDLYAFTMAQVAFRRYRDLEVEYSLKCRTADFDFRPFFERIQMEIEGLGSCIPRKLDLFRLSRVGVLDLGFVNYIRDFRYDPSKHIDLSVDKDTGELRLSIKGPWLETILYPTPVLAILSEVCNTGVDLAVGWTNVFNKAKVLEGNEPLNLFEFGTRRRYSKYWQELVFEFLRAKNLISGTSNIYLGSSYNIPIIGTVAHEYFQVMQAVAPNLEDFLTYALDVWMDEYPNCCKTTLTDIVGARAFFERLERRHVKHYTGFRHDSGDANKYSRLGIDRLKELRADPKEKTFVYSDGLDVQDALDLRDRWEKEVKVNTAIGTMLSNDFRPDAKAISMVIKMVNCDGKPVAKISDSDGKGMCEDPVYEKKLRDMFYEPL